MTMPHSVSPNSKSSPAAVKDEPMEEDSAIPSSVANADGDVDMDQAQTKPEQVKLEDLFADVDDEVDGDGEFPSSAPVDALPGSQSPTASPV